MIIETEPCKYCDFAPCVCGRDIEDCMKERGENVIDDLTNTERKYLFVGKNETESEDT